MKTVAVFSTVEAKLDRTWLRNFAHALTEHQFEVAVVGAGLESAFLSKLQVEIWRAQEPLPDSRALGGGEVAVEVDGSPSVWFVPSRATAPAPLEPRRVVAALEQIGPEVTLLYVDPVSDVQPFLDAADLCLVLAAPATGSLHHLARFGRVVTRRRRDLPVRYVVVDHLWRGLAQPAHLLAEIPRRFRWSWLGRGDAPEVTPATDAEFCLGITALDASEDAGNSTVFALKPADLGQRLSAAGVYAARNELRTQAGRLLASLGLREPDAPSDVAEPEMVPPLARTCRIVGARDAARTHDPLADNQPLSALLGNRCLLLFGEPGMGKTECAKALLAEGYAYVELRPGGALPAPVNEAVALDGIDDTGDVRGFVTRLSDWLASNPPPGRLALFSRNTPEDGRLRELLEGHFGASMVVAELEALTDDEVRRLAVSRIGHERTEALMGTLASSHELRRLAGRPITLELLLERHDVENAPSADPVALYDEGLWRIMTSETETLGHTQRIARALAWVSVYTKQPELAWGGSGAVPLKAFCHAFGFEKGAVSRTLDRNTRLFIEVGARRWRFAHHSFAEFLAAQHVHVTKLPVARVAQFLYLPTGSDRHLLGHLQGTANWLARMDVRLARRFVDTDPVGLWNAESHVPVEERLRWLKRLVEAHRAGRLRFMAPPRRYSAFRVEAGPSAPRVAQLSRALVDDDDPALQYVGIAVLTYCGDPGDPTIAPAFEAVVRDTRRLPWVRGAAAWALRERGAYAHLASVAPMLAGEIEGDDNHELREALLWSTWPDHLEPIEAIRAYRHGARPGYGEMEAFYLTHATEIASNLRQQEFVEALDWARTVDWPFDLEGQDRPSLPREVVRNAAYQLGDARIARAFTDLLLDWNERLFFQMAQLEVFDWAVLSDEVAALAGELCRRPLTFAQARSLGWSLAPALDEHAELLVGSAERCVAADPEQACRWAGLATLCPDAWTPEMRARLERLSGLCPDLHALLHPAPYEPRRFPKRAPRSSPLAEVRRCLALDTGSGREWPSLWFTVRFDARSQRPTDWPVWELLEPEERNAAVNLALRFLDTRTVEAPADPRGLHDVTAAWAFLVGVRPDAAPAPTWEKWAWVFWGCDRAVFEAARGRLGARLDAAFPQGLARFGDRALDLLDPDEWTDAHVDRAIARLSQAEDGQLLERLLKTTRTTERAAAWCADRSDEGWVVTALLNATPDAAWALIFDRFASDDDYARDLLRSGMAYRLPRAPAKLVDLYLRLMTDAVSGDQASYARGEIVRRLTIDGQADALARLRHGFPEQPWLARAEAEAEAVRAEASWHPPSIEALAKNAARLQSAEDLLDVVMGALERLQAFYDGDLSDWKGLFNKAGGAWEPRHETLMAHTIAGRLGEYLNVDGIATTVESNEQGGSDRVDIVFAKGADLKVKVEVKKCVYKAVYSAVETQLKRYIRNDEQAGAYLVIWWPPGLTNRDCCDYSALRARLQDEIDALHDAGRRARLFILRVGPSKLMDPLAAEFLD